MDIPASSKKELIEDCWKASSDSLQSMQDSLVAVLGSLLVRAMPSLVIAAAVLQAFLPSLSSSPLPCYSAFVGGWFVGEGGAAAAGMCGVGTSVGSVDLGVSVAMG